MRSDNSKYLADWYRRHPDKRREYRLRENPGVKSRATLKAEALARTEKACSKCSVVKPMVEFPKNLRHRDGKESACLACLRQRTKAWKDIKRGHQAKERQAREAKNPRPIYVIPEGHKRCNKCGSIKELACFPRRNGYTTSPCKQCACDYAKAAYHKNPDKSYEYHRQWCKGHPEEIKALRRAAYRKANPGWRALEDVKAAKAVKATRTEKACKKCGRVQPMDAFGLCNTTADGRQYQCLSCTSERERKHYAANPQVLEYKKRWNKLNPETGRQVAHRRRARQHSVPGSHTRAEWLKLCANFDNRCVCCGKKGKLTRDHIIPITNPNASNDISAIQPLCYSCNSAKGNRHCVDYRKTPFIRSGQQVLFV